MQIEIDNVKGFQDFLPPESLKRSAINEVIKKYCKLYGFQPIETPVIEFDELMKPENLPNEKMDDAVSDRFRLKDRAGRNLGLRYEFTFQLSRIFKQNPNIKLPFRRYQIGPVFRDEPIGKGRFRQFTQCDADIIGDPSVNAELDCLLMVSDILKELRIESEILVNNRRLLYSIIESVQIDSKEQVMKELDKLDKIGIDNVKINMKKYADTNQIITLFKLLEKPLEFFGENAFEGSKEISSLIDQAKKYGLNLRFSPFMIRGLGYYTGNIFEVKKPGENSIAGGGRYDKLVGKYINREIPAVGISFGLERISELGNIDIKKETTAAVIISINQEKESQKIAKELRKSGISCIVTEEKPGKALEYANSLSIPYVVFIGEEEKEKNKIKLKDMDTGREKLLSTKQLIKALL